jgi:hypothetical protein
MRVRDRDMPSPQHLAVRRRERGSGVLQAPCSAQSEFYPSIRALLGMDLPGSARGWGKMMDDGPAARGGTRRGETFIQQRRAWGGEEVGPG